MNTEELRAKVADVLRTRAEGWFIGAFDYDPIIEAVPSLLDEIDRLLEAYRTVCDYAETADALVAEVADLRAVRGHWQSVAMEWAAVAEERVAEVAALRRQIEAVEAERDAQLQRAARWQHVAAEALRATYCDAATPEAMAENVVRAINSAQRAAVSSVPDVPAEHRRTDPACVFHEPPDPGFRLDEESRGLSCPVCMPEVTR